jgi:hypothetical protein
LFLPGKFIAQYWQSIAANSSRVTKHGIARGEAMVASLVPKFHRLCLLDLDAKCPD